jgi:hypothetical protein
MRRIGVAAFALKLIPLSVTTATQWSMNKAG